VATYTDVQLDALRELANIGSGNAGTALSSMLGKPTDISVPQVAALPVPDAVAACGDPAELRHAVVVPIVGDMPAHVLLLFPEDDAAALTATFGLTPDSDDGRSMLAEMGNILGTSYINALAQMLGLEVEPAPPLVVADMLAAIVSSVLLGREDAEQDALMMDSHLWVEGEQCALSFLLLPSTGGITELLSRIGL
jgi:chemotaxis protein CheC